eukprot:COSAG01_NODE_6260_length_3765_cov_4.701037_4_plen_36_part_00
MKADGALTGIEARALPTEYISAVSGPPTYVPGALV